LEPVPHESITQSWAISVVSTLSALTVVPVANAIGVDLEIPST
jgi:hypothetical protein